MDLQVSRSIMYMRHNHVPPQLRATLYRHQVSEDSASHYARPFASYCIAQFQFPSQQPHQIF
jgi:hypothetical protein